MKKLKLYLETTVFNFYFADDAPDKKQDTQQLFNEIRLGKYEPYTSFYVTAEFDAASENKKQKLYELLHKYEIKILPATTEIEDIAAEYIQQQIIPEKYSADANHIAAATFYSLDAIVSYNFKHIVKLKTKKYSNEINKMLGYNEIEIVTPTEVVEYDE